MEFNGVLTDGIHVVFLFSAKMFKGSKERGKAADTFFNQQDKNEDGYLDRVSFLLAPVSESIGM